MANISAKDIGGIFSALRSYDYGHATDALDRVETCMRASREKPDLRELLQRELIRTLESDAPVAAKQFACTSLWRLGPEPAAPALATLLGSPDEHLVEAACYAIAVTPSARTDDVLRTALTRVRGRGLLAVVNLIGNRRDPQGVPALAALAQGGDRPLAEAAIRALGKIATPEAVVALAGFESGARAPLAAEALLQAGQNMASRGEAGAAGEAPRKSKAGAAKSVDRGSRTLLESLRADGNGFAPLYNGRDLSEWEVDTTGLWTVRNGVIIGRSPGLRYNDFLRTKKEYENFILRAKLRLIDGAGNSGIQFRSQPVAGSHEVEGYQADAAERFWGALYDESRRRKTLAGPTDEFLDRLDIGAWHTYVISAQGNRIRIQLDGVETVNYEEHDPGIARAGIIALQLHADRQPVEVWFRDLMIKVQA